MPETLPQDTQSVIDPSLQGNELALASPEIRANTIIEASQHVLDGTWAKFTVDAVDPRYAGATRGGSALGGKEQREMYIADPSTLIEPVRQRLVEVLGQSADQEAKDVSSAKNAKDAQTGVGFWTIGDLVHSTGVGNTSGILRDGLLCSELHGARAKNDTTPLEADFSEIVDDVKSVKEAIGKELSTYSADRGGLYSVILKFRRDVDSVDYGEEGFGNLDQSPSHRTVFVGLPSTEISGIQIVGENADPSEVIRQVTEGGQYIPVYDTEDKLIFTPEDFTNATGREITRQEQVGDTSPQATEQVEKLKKQLPRLAKKLIDLAQKPGVRYGMFQSEIGSSNRKYSHGVGNIVGNGKPTVFMNSRTWNQTEDPRTKVSVQLDNGEQVHVWDRGDGRTDAFISSLDAPARPISEDELPRIRADIAKAISGERDAFQAQRTETKTQLKMDEEEYGDEVY